MQPELSRRERERPSLLPRRVLWTGVLLLLAGLGAAIAGGEQWLVATRLLVDLGLAAVISVPVLNLAAIMTVEWRRRDRFFALAAAFVLALLLANVFWRS